jgi:acyl-CoA thioesterase-1
VLRDTYSARSVGIANLALAGTVTYQALPTGSYTPNRPSPLPGSNIDAALNYYPKAVLVSYPTNDIAAGYTVDEIVANVTRIRQVANARGVPVIVLGTQPRNLTASQLALLQPLDQRLAALFSPCFVAVRVALAGADGRLAPIYDSGDGTHPNDAGHAVIAARVVSLIDSGRCVYVSGR